MKKLNYYLILFFIIVVIITDLVNKKSFYFRTITDSVKYFGYFNGVNYTYGYMENSGALVYENDPQLKNSAHTRPGAFGSSDKNINPVPVIYYLK